MAQEPKVGEQPFLDQLKERLMHLIPTCLILSCKIDLRFLFQLSNEDNSKFGEDL